MALVIIHLVYGAGESDYVAPLSITEDVAAMLLRVGLDPADYNKIVWPTSRLSESSCAKFVLGYDEAEVLRANISSPITIKIWLDQVADLSVAPTLILKHMSPTRWHTFAQLAGTTTEVLSTQGVALHAIELRDARWQASLRAKVLLEDGPHDEPNGNINMASAVGASVRGYGIATPPVGGFVESSCSSGLLSNKPSAGVDFAVKVWTAGTNPPSGKVPIVVDGTALAAWTTERWSIRDVDTTKSAAGIMDDVARKLMVGYWIAPVAATGDYSCMVHSLPSGISQLLPWLAANDGDVIAGEMGGYDDGVAAEVNATLSFTSVSRSMFPPAECGRRHWPPKWIIARPQRHYSGLMDVGTPLTQMPYTGEPDWFHSPTTKESRRALNIPFPPTWASAGGAEVASAIVRDDLPEIVTTRGAVGNFLAIAARNSQIGWKLVDQFYAVRGRILLKGLHVPPSMTEGIDVVEWSIVSYGPRAGVWTVMRSIEDGRRVIPLSSHHSDSRMAASGHLQVTTTVTGDTGLMAVVPSVRSFLAAITASTVRADFPARWKYSFQEIGLPMATSAAWADPWDKWDERQEYPDGYGRRTGSDPYPNYAVNIRELSNVINVAAGTFDYGPGITENLTPQSLLTAQAVANGQIVLMYAMPDFDGIDRYFFDSVNPLQVSCL